MHGYFTWYEPFVAGATLVSLLWLLLAVARAATGRTERASGEPVPFASCFGELFGPTFLFLLVQESFERTAETGRPAVAMFTPAALLALTAAAAVGALALAAARCLGRAAVSALLRAPEQHVGRGEVQRWHLALAPVLRPRPLAERFGLRAPPFSAA